MKDLISREEAIRVLREKASEIHVNNKRFEVLEKEYAAYLIENLPSAQPEPQWIPVNERLPENDDFVLITMDDSITVRGEYFEQLSINIGFYKDNEWHWGYEIGQDYWPETTHVTAWMSLPEVYKEECNG